MGLRKGKKKKSQLPPTPGFQLPPLPGVDAPQTGLPMPAPLPLPLAPLPEMVNPPQPAESSLLTPAPLPKVSSTSSDESSADNQYGDMWAKRSDKPLQQIYGHIDRISTNQAGSLLDRYADRFGHSLDRDIIVLRKKEHDDKVSEIRDAPTVQLIEDDINDGDLESQLAAIEDELRSLKPEYQAAKSAGDTELLSQIRPVLQGLMDERKSIQSMIAGDAPTVAEEAEDSADEDKNLFETFVSIVDDLLGSNLSEEVINEFIASEDFAVYQEVGGDPNGADADLRSQFFSIVDGQLGNMDEDKINEFVQSESFSVYSAVGALYQ
jgi:hypothetical protein